MLKTDWNIDHSWSLFLDRDGVINERVFGGYITEVKDFNFIPGVLNAVALLSQEFNHTVVVTNQQGIGKGLMKESNLLEIHTYMCDQFEKNGGEISECFFASNLRGDNPDFRKPKPAMAMMAKEKYPTIDFSKSIMVGDTDSDILFGKNVGMKTVRIKTEEPIGVEADLTVNNLLELAKQIVL